MSREGTRGFSQARNADDTRGLLAPDKVSTSSLLFSSVESVHEGLQFDLLAEQAILRN